MSKFINNECINFPYSVETRNVKRDKINKLKLSSPHTSENET